MTKEELQAMYDELMAKNEELVKQLEEKAETKKAVEPLQLPDANITPMIPYVEKETVKIKLFRDDYRYKRPLYVSINGRNWLIPRGVEVELPKYVADFIDNLAKEEAEIQERIIREEQEYRELTAKQV